MHMKRRLGRQLPLRNCQKQVAICSLKFVTCGRGSQQPYVIPFKRGDGQSIDAERNAIVVYPIE